MARFGFTTGSCSAAAAKAAAYMLLTGKIKSNISIETPKGIDFLAEILDISRSEDRVKCAVLKDGGDDPDVTTGAHIYAEVSYLNSQNGVREVVIEGGQGVGIVTKPGLDQPVGNAAINSVPRKMIIKEVTEVMDFCDYNGSVKVIISVLEGKAIAKQTFNERLGIVDGISILGTSGIVEPMSSEALLATIQLELNQKKQLGWKYVPVSPGNYGLEYMKRTYDFDLDVSVKCSNFIGDTIDMVAESSFSGMLLTGHIGKLVKVAGGVMNTHSKYGDRRMELISASAQAVGVSTDTICQLMECVATEDAIDILDSIHMKDVVMEHMMTKIMEHLSERVNGRMQIECMVYSNKHGMLAKSAGAEQMLVRLKQMI